MKLLLVLVLAVAVAVNGQTLCVKYSTLTGLSNRALITLAVNTSVFQILEPNVQLVKWFDGSFPTPGRTNYLTNAAAFAALFEDLVRFFGQALGCNDGTIPAYDGATMAAAHATLQINFYAYAKFNSIVSSVVRSAGFDANDTAAVASTLHTLKADICTQPDCNNICNKYSVPYNTDNVDLVSAVVTGTVNAALASNNLRQFFNGQTPAGSIDYTNPANSAAFNTLATHLIQFFGSALGCTDGTIGAYTGRDMKSAHQNIPINLASFNEFNSAVISVMASAGVSSADQAAVLGVLESTKADICNQPDCSDSESSPASYLIPFVAFVLGLLFLF